MKLNLRVRGTRKRNYGLNSRLLSGRKTPHRTDCKMEEVRVHLTELAHMVSGFTTGLVPDSLLRRESGLKTSGSG